MSRGLGPSQRRTHKCPAPVCGEQVPSFRLACRPHWYVLPEPLRADVLATNRPHYGAAHSAAVAAAAAWLAERYPA
jgi:hypothetical protein